MKYLSLIIIAAALFFTPQLQAQAKPDKLYKQKVIVRGNCEMCEETIEKAALSVDGVKKASWDQEQEILMVIYQPKTTDIHEIEQAVAASGYDTKRYVGSQEAYNDLPNCCQYDDKKVEKSKK